MKEHYLKILANIWMRSKRARAIDEQYVDLWKFAHHLATLGFPLERWHPPADTPAESLSIRSFATDAVSAEALAMARADRDNSSDIRILGAWNGIDDRGGMIISSTEDFTYQAPSSFRLTASDQQPLMDAKVAAGIVQKILEIWAPILVRVAPHGYHELAVFRDRPAVGWMVYLPLKIGRQQAPEAAELIPVLDERRKQKGTIVVSVAETFDLDNPAHVKTANAIEMRLADQDLLPLSSDLLNQAP